MEKAVVLLSGGLDSCTCMAVAKSKGYEVYPISFNYHQRHIIELEGAKKIAAYFKVPRHLIIETNMDASRTATSTCRMVMSTARMCHRRTYRRAT